MKDFYEETISKLNIKYEDKIYKIHKKIDRSKQLLFKENVNSDNMQSNEDELEIVVPKVSVKSKLLSSALQISIGFILQYFMTYFGMD